MYKSGGALGVQMLNSATTLIQRDNQGGSPMQTMYYIGLDVHKKKISYCVKDGSGHIHAEGAIPAARSDLDRWMKTLPAPFRARIYARGGQDTLPIRFAGARGSSSSTPRANGSRLKTHCCHLWLWERRCHAALLFTLRRSHTQPISPQHRSELRCNAPVRCRANEISSSVRIGADAALQC